MKLQLDSENDIRSWNIAGTSFCIELRRWQCNWSQDLGRYRWNIYANIFEPHPLFKKIYHDGKLNKYEAENIPLHGGVTYLALKTVMQERDHAIKERVVVGCDYCHLYDSYYTELEEPSSFEGDVSTLFDFLESLSKGEVCGDDK